MTEQPRGASTFFVPASGLCPSMWVETLRGLGETSVRQEILESEHFPLGNNEAPPGGQPAPPAVRHRIRLQDSVLQF